MGADPGDAARTRSPVTGGQSAGDRAVGLVTHRAPLSRRGHRAARRRGTWLSLSTRWVPSSSLSLLRPGVVVIGNVAVYAVFAALMALVVLADLGDVAVASLAG